MSDAPETIWAKKRITTGWDDCLAGKIEWDGSTKYRRADLVPQWLSIERDQPKKGQDVLTYWPGDERLNPVIVKNEYNPKPRDLGSCDWWNSKPDQIPTHWMPLPEPPIAWQEWPKHPEVQP